MTTTTPKRAGRPAQPRVPPDSGWTWAAIDAQRETINKARGEKRTRYTKERWAKEVLKMGSAWPSYRKYTTDHKADPPFRYVVANVLAFLEDLRTTETLPLDRAEVRSRREAVVRDPLSGEGVTIVLERGVDYCRRKLSFGKQCNKLFAVTTNNQRYCEEHRAKQRGNAGRIR